MRLGINTDLERFAHVHGVTFIAKADSRLMRFFGWLLGVFGNDRFMLSQWTTLGHRIYYPASVEPVTFDMNRWRRVVLHEFRHILDRERWPVWFTLTYLCGPLPVLLSFGRVYWEAKGYAMQIALYYGRGYDIETVTGWLWRSYFWPLPRPWIRAVLRWQVRRYKAGQ